jgi:putative tricarboxylic transport membrane protein
MLDGLMIGLTTVLTLHNLMLVFAGCATGTLIGMLPGLGPITAIALMIPITYGFNPSSGMILLAGVYYGAIFGGSTSSILVNAVATAFYGYPIARQGQPGKALAIAAYASFAGGTMAALLLAATAPFLADLSLGFQSADYFALMLLGLTLVSAFSSQGEYLKALMMTCLGLMLSTVGTDLSAGVQRFTFGRMDLIDGLSFLMLAMATFALSEAVMMVLKPTGNSRPTTALTQSSLKLSLPDLRSIIPSISRSSVLGFFVGVLPGAGATIASFLAYGVEKSLASTKDQAQFGKGSLKGLAAPEAANNAACTGSFVPLLTLGIPGSGTTAILLGALLAYGIQPGPRLFIDEPEIFWSVIVSMYFGNLMLLVLNLPLIPYIARLLLVPREYLIPIIMFFSLMGVYLVSFNVFDIHMMVIIAIFAVVLRLLEYPMAPLLLGFILGGMLEDNLRRALAVADGQFSFLWDRPTTMILMALVVIAIIVPLTRAITRARGN